MGTLAKWEKQPAEILDYDISFVDFLAVRAGFAGATPTILSISVTADAGITVLSSSHADGIVKVWLSGGTDGVSYKITVVAQISGNLTKEAEITVKVKDL